MMIMCYQDLCSFIRSWESDGHLLLSRTGSDSGLLWTR